MRTNEEQAQALTIIYYGRPADPASLWEWTDKLAVSGAAEPILEAFGSSEEYLTAFGLLDFDNRPVESAQLAINDLYQRIFDRDAGQEGLDFYTNLIVSGEATIASLALDILNGAKGYDTTAIDNKIQVANYFTVEVFENDTPYGVDSIDVAQAVLQIVNDSRASVTYGLSTAECVVDAIVDNGSIDHAIDYRECFSELPDFYQPDFFFEYDVNVL